MTAKPFVFSIRPVYLDMFRAGTKRRLRTRTAEELWRVEFRTRRPNRKMVSPGSRHLIYETAPTMKVVAIATIGEIIEGTPADVWAMTHGPDGISRDDYDDYFVGRHPRVSRAVAIEMTMAWLDVPLALHQCPPQSWARWKGPWPLPGMTGGVGG